MDDGQNMVMQRRRKQFREGYGIYLSPVTRNAPNTRVELYVSVTVGICGIYLASHDDLHFN